VRKEVARAAHAWDIRWARRPRSQRIAGAAAAGWIFSALWHLMALAVLAMAIHPFQIPQVTPTIEVSLLPPLEPPPPTPERPLERIPPAPAPVRVKPIQVQKARAPTPEKPIQTRPLTVQSPPVITPPAPPVPEALSTSAASTTKPVQIARPSAPVAAKPALNRALELATPPAQTLTPTPAPPVPAPPAAAPAPAFTPPKTVTIQPPSQVVARPVAPLPVLTNDQTAPGPIEIRPPDRPQEAARPAAPALPPSGSGGAAGGGSAGGAATFNGPINGFDAKGLRMSLGCLNPETYHLTAAEREACLQRVARDTRGGPDLGPNIPADKKVEYDRNVACRDANRGGSVPAPGDSTTGVTGIRGLGDIQRLRDCGPGDR
jgi:hypothetical protein